MRHLHHRPFLAATVLMTFLQACTAAAPGATPATTTAGTNQDAAQNLGGFARSLNRLNTAVVNLEHKRPPTMPLRNGEFATKATADGQADLASAPADDAFLHAGLDTETDEAVEKETVLPDGSIEGTIDDNGDGTVDSTFTETKPVETLKADGGKTVAMTYKTDDDGDKSVFAVKEDVDASGNVTGGELDWTDSVLGQQHVTFKGDEISLETSPGILVVLKASGANATGHVKLAGDMIFDERFAASNQAPGNGLPEVKPLSAQAWFYGDLPKEMNETDNRSRIGEYIEVYGGISAGVWCVDNEVGKQPEYEPTAAKRNEHNGWVIRLAWCKIKNHDRWWANEHREKNKARLRDYAMGTPALRVPVAMLSGKQAKDANNMILTMPNGAEMRVTMPAKGNAVVQMLAK